MRLAFKRYFKRIEALDGIDVFAALFLMGCFIVLCALTWNVGLYADDYWNLFEAKNHDTSSYFANHMTNINSRYTYALLNRLMYLLFYDLNDMWGWTYIRAARVFVLFAHCLGVWFVFRSLVLLKLPKLPLLLLLPFIALPSFAHQAIFWIGAAFAHAVGFSLFSIAVYALLTGRYITFSISMFFALGATEFVLMPSLAIVSLHLYFEIRKNREGGVFDKKTVTHLLVLLSPFIAWGLLAFLTSALSVRSEKVVGHVRLLEHPARWVVSYFRRYMIGLQPEVFLREYWYLVLGILASMIVGIRRSRERLVVLFLVSLYPLSFLPLSAIGYSFESLKSLRLYYLPGFFFYIAIFSAFAAFTERLADGKFSIHKKVVGVCIAAVIVAAAAFLAVRLNDRAKDGEKAFNCIRATVDAVKKEADGREPFSVELCGFPELIYDFKLFRGDYAGPYILGLAFGGKDPVLLTSDATCPDRWGIPLEDDRCGIEARYQLEY